MNNAAEFRKLIKRYQSGHITAQEKAALDAFLNEISQDDLFDKLPEDEQNELRDSMRAYLLERIDTPKHRHLLVSSVWLKAAAAIVVLAVASFILWQWQATDMIHVTTASQQQKVILPDGSIIWVKPNSTFDYPSKFTGNERNVSFTGEVFFEVAKDAGHPFVISGSNGTAKVLGTSFNLRMDSLTTELTVLTGKVALNPIGQASILVRAHEKAIYTKINQELAIRPVETTDAKVITSGTEYDMLFEAAPLSEVVDKVQKKFDITISLSNKRMGNCRVTADFTDQSLELTMTKISEMLGYVYEADGRKITLTGEGCN